MEKTYLCDEQVYQMQAKMDAIYMVKMLHDHGCDIKKEPISITTYNWGDQSEVFHEAIRRLFPQVNSVSRSQYEEVWEFQCYFPVLERLESLDLIELNTRCKSLFDVECPYFEMVMQGALMRDALHFKISGVWGYHANFLENIISIKNLVLSFVKEKEDKLLRSIEKIILLKMFPMLREYASHIDDWTPMSLLQNVMGIDESGYEKEEMSFKEICEILKNKIVPQEGEVG
ncbi:hypothetical protein QP794_23435 [Paenibacillus sp. UMB7766-LJ446]|uniref:hypothetical protein n=1 Tax=Paenibacillus sp. UMB7766-LJ446 TaxID=3046313 RepID=UPI0025509ACA|nr:hypothetical protein [Paenibacillus sp. UMB7766-LJ446]MDK8193047.1 hypothetical protein [Paenibacillus sp. UMB7766-LJ446]